MKANSLQNSQTSRHALHEVLGGVSGALLAAVFAGMFGGPLAAYLGAIIGAGMGAYASWAADGNAAHLVAEEGSPSAEPAKKAAAISRETERRG
jgi:hypothetical protein